MRKHTTQYRLYAVMEVASELLRLREISRILLCMISALQHISHYYEHKELKSYLLLKLLVDGIQCILDGHTL